MAAPEKAVLPLSPLDRSDLEFSQHLSWTQKRQDKPEDVKPPAAVKPEQPKKQEEAVPKQATSEGEGSSAATALAPATTAATPIPAAASSCPHRATAVKRLEQELGAKPVAEAVEAALFARCGSDSSAGMCVSTQKSAVFASE